jgi:hypothetical protein
MTNYKYNKITKNLKVITSPDFVPLFKLVKSPKKLDKIYTRSIKVNEYYLCFYYNKGDWCHIQHKIKIKNKIELVDVSLTPQQMKEFIECSEFIGFGVSKHAKLRSFPDELCFGN